VTARDEDAEAVALVLAGDLDAFEGIVRRWQGRLLNLAWRFSRDRATAEDMAQDAFVSAFRALGTFRGDAAFSTWLTAIALNGYRARLRRDGLPMASFDPSRLLSTGPGADQMVEARQTSDTVRRIVATLPRRYREALVLFYLEELDLAETARVLGVKEGTLKARLSRGRELVRRRCLGLGLLAPPSREGEVT
jgi:RNA polymerase sigma-70 factor (ECF subfamily)